MKLIRYSQASIFILYYLVGIIGFLAYGNDLNSVVLLNMDLKSVICIFILCLFSITLALTFPL